MPEPLKISLVGAGHMGRLHARALVERPDVRLLAVCDTDLAAATAAHRDLALALLEAGLALLIEKPLAASAAEARDIVQAARDRRAVVQVGHILRFDPVTRALADRPFVPRRIEAVWRSPFTGRSTDVSVVADMMIHPLDLVLAWTGRMPHAVRAAGRVVKGPHLDEVEARLDFPGGCEAHLVASRVSESRERRIRMLVRRSPPAGRAGLGEGGETDAGSITLDYAARSAECDGKALPVEAAPDALRAQLSAFLAAVRAERPAGSQREVAVSADAGLRAVEVVERIEQAALGRSSVQAEGLRQKSRGQRPGSKGP